MICSAVPQPWLGRCWNSPSESWSLREPRLGRLVSTEAAQEERRRTATAQQRHRGEHRDDQAERPDPPLGSGRAVGLVWTAHPRSQSTPSTSQRPLVASSRSFSVASNASVAYGLSPFHHCCADTPVWCNHAVANFSATVSGVAAPGLVTGSGGDGGVSTLSSPSLGSALAASADAVAGAAPRPAGGGGRDPENPRRAPTIPNTTTARTSAIPYRVPSRRRIRCI